MYSINKYVELYQRDEETLVKTIIIAPPQGSWHKYSNCRASEVGPDHRYITFEHGKLFRDFFKYKYFFTLSVQSSGDMNKTTTQRSACSKVRTLASREIIPISLIRFAQRVSNIETANFMRPWPLYY